jgi:transposase InsO family protein
MNGKVERFIGTMRAKSLLGTDDPTLERSVLLRDLQRHRQFYNCERPHHALNWRTPRECLMLALDQSDQHPP